MRLILDDFSRDLAHGIRLLRRNRGFAAVNVSTLAVAIAATLTVFSIVDAWLLRPLNFPDADRLVIAFAAAPDKPSEPAVWLPYRAYLGWKEQSRSFASISAAFFRGVTISTPDDARSEPQFAARARRRTIGGVRGMSVAQGQLAPAIESSRFVAAARWHR